MIDGSFRENTYGAQYFTQQDFPDEEYEVIWVEFYKRANEELYYNNDLKIITLNNTDETTYHSSYCFNEGIKLAKGELLIIPDADVIVHRDFMQKAWDAHKENKELVAYGYRRNEVSENKLNSLEFDELEEKCVITNPINYGGCMTVRKKWMLKINGYDQHEIFESGFHANGLDIYTRFKNLGLPIKWDHSLKLYHPRHAFTAEKAPVYEIQRKLVSWRSANLEYLPLKGLDEGLNTKAHYSHEYIKKTLIENKQAEPNYAKTERRVGVLKRIYSKLFK